jgi:TPR repeat protein/uncharacterized caspase-like protein
LQHVADRSGSRWALRCIGWLLAAAWILGLGIGPALAERKVALVIGNAAYQHTRVLSNPKNDAEAIAELLRRIGFDDVTLKVDLDYKSMRDTIRAFAAKVAGSDVALIYYAGHGIEGAGQNYLVPTDAKLVSDLDLEYEAITLSSVLTTVGQARKLKLVILDACRNNPMSDKMTVASGVTREWTRGLRAIEPKGDLLVAYAASAGTVALDGTGKHSPFADALLKHMPTPGLDVYRMLGKVKETVLEATGRKQEPHVYGSPGGEVIALVPAPTPPQAPAKLPEPAALLDLPPDPEVLRKRPKTEASTGSGLSAEVVRICAGLQDMKSLPMLRKMAEQYKGSGAAGCIAVRIEELTSETAAKNKAADEKSVLADPPMGPTPSFKTPDAPPKAPAPSSSLKAPDPSTKASSSTLKGHDGTAKTPDPASKAIPSPSVGEGRGNVLSGTPAPKAYDPPSASKSLTPTASAPVTECDRLASSPDSPPQPGVKVVPLALLDASRAIPVCQEAVQRYPADSRLQGLLGRAFHKAGRYEEARQWYERAIEKSDPLALNNLGSIYESGQGVPKDYARALSLYHRAVEAGNTFSLRNIGRMYEYGGGVAQDYGIARSWYERAVQKGEPGGMHELGRLYQEGKGVPQDFAIARSWYEQAAQKDYAPSMTQLGWLYETGRGGPQDGGMAHSWYEKAAAAGNSTASYNLSQLLARGGVGISRDPRSAARYLLTAARAGNPTARGDLDGDMGAWAEDVRRALQDMLFSSGDYRGSVSGWWDQPSSDAARAHYMRSR